MLGLMARLHAAQRNREQTGRTDGFVLPASTSVRSLAGFYGFVCQVHENDMSLGDYIAQRFGGQPQVGDGMAWERAELIVTEIKGGAVSKICLRILPLRDRRMSFSEILPRNPKRRVQDEEVGASRR